MSADLPSPESSAGARGSAASLQTRTLLQQPSYRNHGKRFTNMKTTAKNTTDSNAATETEPRSEEASRSVSGYATEGECRPKDRIKTVPSARDVNVWYLMTEDNIGIGVINSIVGEGFAKGLVEAWNAESSDAAGRKEKNEAD